MRPTTLLAAVATVLGMHWGLSLSLSEELADPALIADVAVAAEEHGWDGIFVWDHLWNRTFEPFADPWITLAAVAVATERVLIGPMITPLPRHRVQLVAQQATTLDRLSGGRVVLSLGLGVDSYGEYSLFDEPASDDKARAAALAAGLELLVPMLTGGPVLPLGDRVTTAAGARSPRVPIWIAGISRYTAGPRRAARHGLEGLALVGDGDWSPATVAAALDAGGLPPGSLDVALVGGAHPDPVALEAAGATWCIPEIEPGESAAAALSRAATRP
jgi:alkanesulfonate monooxygenase SsuD/methylene tetrahydromethanopterin reductase-like flavin-dependent oxidoreductase (luciferase family)